MCSDFSMAALAVDTMQGLSKRVSPWCRKRCCVNGPTGLSINDVAGQLPK